MRSVDSVKKEIDDHRGIMPESQWLAEKGLIDTPQTSYDYNVVHDWYQPGSESYILDFEINTAADSKRLIAKACIKMRATQTVAEWHQRRQRIDEAGIETPRLYSTHRAVYIEEYIALNLKEAHERAAAEDRYKLESGFIDTYRKLGALGFSVMSLHDVRSRGTDIVLVDFGSDLGGFRDAPHEGSDYGKKAEGELKRILRS